MRVRTERGRITRATLLSRIRRHLIDPHYPRVQMLFILGLAGLVTALASFLMLHLGLQHMGIRYGLAVLSGYLAFVALIRMWASRQQLQLDVDVGSAADWSNHHSDGSVYFGGGRSGGGGGGASWDDGTTAEVARSGGADFVADEMWPLVLLLACLAGGVIALAYVLYLAPVLLAEIALETAVLSAVYRKARRIDSGTWLRTVLRRTWMPALVLFLTALALGIGVQWLSPTADSLGDLLREVASGN